MILGGWKDDGKGRAPSLLAFHTDLPFMVFNDAIADGEPQAYPLHFLLGCKEGFEDLIPYLLGDPNPDVFNMDEVMHALGTRLHPIEGISASSDRVGWSLVPYLSAQERTTEKLSTLVCDCTWPAKWTKADDIPVRTSFKTSYPKALQEDVIAKWKAYGFPEETP